MLHVLCLSAGVARDDRRRVKHCFDFFSAPLALLQACHSHWLWGYGGKRTVWIVAILVPASRIGRSSAGFGHEKKEIWFSIFIAFCLGHSICNGSNMLSYPWVEIVAVKDVRNGDSWPIHSNISRILTWVDEALFFRWPYLSTWICTWNEHIDFIVDSVIFQCKRRSCYASF